MGWVLLGTIDQKTNKLNLWESSVSTDRATFEVNNSLPAFFKKVGFETLSLIQEKSRHQQHQRVEVVSLAKHTGPIPEGLQANLEMENSFGIFR